MTDQDDAGHRESRRRKLMQAGLSADPAAEMKRATAEFQPVLGKSERA